MVTWIASLGGGAVSLRGRQHALGTLYSLLSTRTERSLVVFSITFLIFYSPLLHPLMPQREILSNESF